MKSIDTSNLFPTNLYVQSVVRLPYRMSMFALNSTKTFTHSKLLASTAECSGVHAWFGPAVKMAKSQEALQTYSLAGCSQTATT